MVSLIEIKKRIIQRYKHYREDYLEYSKIIKKVAKLIFKDDFIKVVVFGSTVVGNYRPDSDIDVAIILRRESNENKRLEFYKRIKEEIGYFHPFEFHIISEDEWNSWYKRFIKQYSEV